MAGILLVGLLPAGYVGAGYAASNSPAGASTGPTETEPLPDPEPAPDPAPPPPKPAPKPPWVSVRQAPAPVHQQPARTTPNRSYSPIYTATRAAPPARPKGITDRRKHARKRAPKRVAPLPTQDQRVKGTAVEHVQLPPASLLASTPEDPLSRGLVIAGLGLAALLFLLVVAVPASPARSTQPGRLVRDHQTDLVLAGIATLLLTALLFATTGNAS